MFSSIIQTVKAQTTADDFFHAVEQAISKADAQALSNLFNTQVDISIGNKDTPYTRSQALYVVREFFMNYPVRSFAIRHKGSTGTTLYAIGEYYSSRGKFDTNIFIKKVGNTFVIEQLRFEQDK
ncbi:MAG: DUF4783 domain-containing protein [Bacteroidia bacterium]|nr:DUF4783 domain-containing protein [Bacteroidia bacterium]MDW8157659.1 DUF4783 domain-containing protein [Bacteroidia bacterium]